MINATLSPLPEKMLGALQALNNECVPHPCGGFTTDDMEWRMGTAFTGERALSDALEELRAAGLVHYAGFDENDAIGHCYALHPARLDEGEWPVCADCRHLYENGKPWCEQTQCQRAMMDTGKRPAWARRNPPL